MYILKRSEHTRYTLRIDCVHFLLHENLVGYVEFGIMPGTYNIQILRLRLPLVETLRHKLESCGFISRCCDLNFSLT